VRVFIQDQSGDHNFDTTIEVKPVEFVNQVRQAGGYYVLDTRDNVVFVPWHNIHFIRFEEENE